MNWYLDVLKQYAVFNGRATRQQYWMFFLINFGISIVLTILGGFVSLLAILSFVYSLAVLLPGIGVAIRRLHDTGRSGWWLLIGLIPLLGALVLIWFMVQDSVPDNQFGPNPKAMAAAA